MDKSTLEKKFGALIFENTSHTKKISITPPNDEMVIYVKVSSKVSNSSHEADEMYAMTPEGKIIREYTHDIDNWATFRKNFNNALIK